MIRDGFNIKPLVTLFLWTGSGDDVCKERLPVPVTVRRYTYGDKEAAEERLIALVLTKAYEDDGEIHVAEAYDYAAVLPVFCHFLMVRKPSWWVRLRRLFGLTDYSVRQMRRLLGPGRLDIRSTLNSICRLTVGPEFTAFERRILTHALIGETRPKPEQMEERDEADFYHGLLAHLGLKPDDVRGMTAWEINQLCGAARRESQRGSKGTSRNRYERIKAQMGHVAG